MTVIYSNIEEKKNSTIKSEPYKRLTEEYRRIKDQGDIDGQEIWLKNLSEKEGFHTDEDYMQNPRICFRFFKGFNKGGDSSSTLVQMEFSFDFVDDDTNWCVGYYQKRMKYLRRKIPHLFIPYVSYFEFSHSIEDSFCMNFNGIVENEANILDASYFMITLLVALFAFED